MRSLIHSVRSRCRRSQFGLVLAIALMVIAIVIHPAVAQPSSVSSNQIDGYPIVLDGNVLFRVKQGIPGVVSAEERASVINERLANVANDSSISPDNIRVEEQENASVVFAGDTVLFTVRDRDREQGQSRQAIAQKTVEILQSAVAQYRSDRSIQQIARGIALAILSTIAFVIFWVLLQRFTSRLLIKIKQAQQADALNLRLQNLQLLGSDAASYLLSTVVKTVQLILVLINGYLYIPFVLSQFPTTRAIGNSIFEDIVYRFNQLVSAFVQYLPNLVLIGLIVVITYYVIQFAKLVIIELGRDDAYPWFYPEWIQPTNRLATILLIAIACIVATPYLPGVNSPAFRGVSLFLGALFTLGSSSAVANAIAGIILIYTRAFRLGDIIRIGDSIGEVIEKSLFVTRILTFKQEVITLPNSSVLNSNVVNFNAVSRVSNRYLLLHTTITLGYDLSWRQVHEVMIQAAIATTGIVAEPRPFVLQTALNDYNVSYELNAYCDRPNKMPNVYSELHQNIQDYCNQAGIEILSPAYSSIRDGNHSTIPSNYLPSDYTAPTFQIHTHNSNQP